MQEAVLLTPGSADAASASIPNFSTSSSTAIYASLFPENTEIRRVKLPISSHLSSEDAICIVHCNDTSSPVNQLANEVSFDSTSSTESSTISGPAYVCYEQEGRAFRVKPDWEALHSACYEGKLSGMAKGSKDRIDGSKLAELFLKRRTELSEASATVTADDEDEEGWEDVEVEKPRENRKEVESDDEDTGNDEDEEEEDSEGSFEDDESELESDDDGDPRKKALLEMIKQSITKDGKLDLERYAGPFVVREAALMLFPP